MERYSALINIARNLAQFKGVMFVGSSGIAIALAAINTGIAEPKAEETSLHCIYSVLTKTKLLNKGRLKW
jgi:hypothetical protein